MVMLERKSSSKAIIYVLISGALSLFIGMGISRFAFTPLLPFMQTDFGFSDTVSGGLASANFLGYLLGAYYVRNLTSKPSAYNWLVASILMSILCLGFMWLKIHLIWYFLRFWAGFWSGFLFVISAEFILNYLSQKNRQELFGIIYCGIGLGMIFSGLLVPLLSSQFNSSQIWLWLAAACALPAVFVVFNMPKPEVSAHPIQAEGQAKNDSKPQFLYVAYFLEGFGYIITGTFISVIVLRGTDSVLLSGYVWVIAGLGAILITPIWALLSKRIGVRQILVLLYCIQSLSIAMPVLFPSTLIAILGAIGYGGTFLGIVSMAIVYGRMLNPAASTTAVLTVFFSLGQVLGPVTAGFMSDLSGGLDLPVMVAAFSVFLGGLILAFNKGASYANH